MHDVKIAEHVIGQNNPCFIIAEAGVNHSGSLKMAYKLVDIAVEAGADAVKFQTFTADRLATAMAPKAAYQQITTNQNESQLEMLRSLELSPEHHYQIKEYCKKNKILFMSSPFDEISADFLEEMGIEVFKIGSGEVTNLPFLSHIASKGKPVILSTGMASLGEVESALEVMLSKGLNDIVVLHCVSNYPADPRDVNLRAIHTISSAFGFPVGFSDHTMGVEISLAAVALGACVIEKHFTLDRNLPGPDQLASLEPAELKAMVSGIRKVEMAMGDGLKKPAASEANTAAVARKSLVAGQDIHAGTMLTEAMIVIKRPGSGLPPTMRPFLVGRIARNDILADTLLSLEMLR